MKYVSHDVADVSLSELLFLFFALLGRGLRRSINAVGGTLAIVRNG